MWKIERDVDIVVNHAPQPQPLVYMSISITDKFYVSLDFNRFNFLPERQWSWKEWTPDCHKSFVFSLN